MVSGIKGEDGGSSMASPVPGGTMGVGEQGGKGDR